MKELSKQREELEERVRKEVNLKKQRGKLRAKKMKQRVKRLKRHQGCIKSHFQAPGGWDRFEFEASQVENDLRRPKMIFHEDACSRNVWFLWY